MVKKFSCTSSCLTVDQPQPKSILIFDQRVMETMFIMSNMMRILTWTTKPRKFRWFLVTCPFFIHCAEIFCPLINMKLSTTGWTCEAPFCLHWSAWASTQDGLDQETGSLPMDPQCCSSPGLTYVWCHKYDLVIQEIRFVLIYFLIILSLKRVGFILLITEVTWYHNVACFVQMRQAKTIPGFSGMPDL